MTQQDELKCPSLHGSSLCKTFYKYVLPSGMAATLLFNWYSQSKSEVSFQMEMFLVNWISYFNRTDSCSPRDCNEPSVVFLLVRKLSNFKMLYLIIKLIICCSKHIVKFVVISLYEGSTIYKTDVIQVTWIIKCAITVQGVFFF